MTTLDEALAGTEPEATTATSTTTPRKCRRHDYELRTIVTPDDVTTESRCWRCGSLRDVVRSRRGKSAARFGKDQERRIERVYGPRKVGEYGDAIDLLGATFKWQSKATHAAPPLWLVSVDSPVVHRPSRTVLGAAEAMLPLRPDLQPLVITSYVSPKGTRDWIWVWCCTWFGMHGGTDPGPGMVVMSGAHFLDIHGRDAEAVA